MSLVVWSLTIWVGCGDDPVRANSNGPRLSIFPESQEIALGLTGVVRAIATYSSGVSADVTSQVDWVVEPTTVASVTSDGYVRSISPGSASVTASLGSATASNRIQVLPPTLESVVHQPSENQYIWFGPPALEGELRFFRRQFTVDTVPSEATLYLAGPRQATVFLNGNVVLNAAEPRPSWQVALMAGVADVSGKISQGTNTLAIATTGGSMLAAKIVPAPQGIDETPITEADAKWRGSLSAAPGWEISSFDDQSWGGVTPLGGIEDNPLNFEGNADMELYQWPGYDGISPWLAHIPIPVKTIMTTVGSVRNSRSGTWLVAMPEQGARPSFVADFGDEFSGRLVMISQTQVPVTVQLSYGESLDEVNGSPYLGTQTVVIPALGRAVGPKGGYRYAKVTFLQGPSQIILGDIYSDKIYYPVSHLGFFDSSDELLNKIWELGEKTVQVGMQVHIWDAPKRDRLPYSGDGYVISSAIGHTFADRFFVENTIDRLAQAAGSSDVNGIPGYDAMWILMLAEDYRRYGNFLFLKGESGFLKSLLTRMEAEIGPGDLFRFPPDAYPFFDWSQNLEPPVVTEGASIGTHLEFIIGFQEGAWLLRQLSDSTANHYTEVANRLQDSARQAFLDPATNTYGPYWQINAMAILSGTATPEQIPSIWNAVLSQPSPFWVTPFLNYFVLNALTQAGYRQVALQLVRSYWGGWWMKARTVFGKPMTRDGQRNTFTCTCMPTMSKALGLVSVTDGERARSLG
jgi:alpha-L-rhamnosidase